MRACTRRDWPGRAWPAALAVALAVAACSRSSAPSPVAAAPGATYYVDCRGGSDSNNGLSAGSPWRTLGRVDRLTLSAGNSVLLARGTRCRGALAVAGSGRSGAPIVVGAYGSGPRPVIDGSGHRAALSLVNQEFWEIGDLELVGASYRGISITAHGGRAYRHLRVTDVLVHDLVGSAPDTLGGLLVMTGARFDDVLIDGFTGYGTRQWYGITVDCNDAGDLWGHNQAPIVIQNSAVHDVGGDGITIDSCRQGVIQHSLAYDTGMLTEAQSQRVANYTTPNAIWTWHCDTCTIQFDEAYGSHSTEKDGGDFDVDFGDTHNVVQYNYGHDSDGYCLSVQGAFDPTIDTIIRYNVCANDGRWASSTGLTDLALSTWGGGYIQGLQVYNNTFYWNPAASKPMLSTAGEDANRNPAESDIRGTAVFENNLVYSSVPTLVAANRHLALDHNLYWYVRPGDPVWRYDGTSYTSLADLRARSGQEAGSVFADPRLRDPTYHAPGMPTTSLRLLPGSPAAHAGAGLPSMGGRDFFGSPVREGAPPNIGADDS